MGAYINDDASSPARVAWKVKKCKMMYRQRKSERKGDIWTRLGFALSQDAGLRQMFLIMFKLSLCRDGKKKGIPGCGYTLYKDH
jgi:hypothetical protein